MRRHLPNLLFLRLMAYHPVSIFHPERAVAFIPETDRSRHKCEAWISLDDIDNRIPEVALSFFGYRSDRRPTPDLLFDNGNRGLNTLDNRFKETLSQVI